MTGRPGLAIFLVPAAIKVAVVVGGVALLIVRSGEECRAHGRPDGRGGA